MTRLILFGAGASYGSVDVQPEKPPLGVGLFEELRRSYPQVWGSIPEEERGKFVPDFERGMAEYWLSGSHATPVLLRSMGHFFTRFRPGPENAYVTLVKMLRARAAFQGTIFSTLNYECILEYAARTAGVEEIDYFGREPSTARSMSVWKIHGSCNFITTAVAAHASAISYGPGVSFDGDLSAVDAVAAARYLEQSAITPALAVFMEGKPVQTAPTLIKMLQERWQEAVEKAEAIAIIGVRPHIVDSHIWEPLAATEARLIVVGDQKSYEDWAATNRTPPRETQIVGSHFAPSIPRVVERLAE